MSNIICVSAQGVETLLSVFSDPAKQSKAGVGTPSQKYYHFWLGLKFRQAPSRPCWGLKVDRHYQAGHPARLVIIGEKTSLSGLVYNLLILAPIWWEQGDEELPKLYDLVVIGPNWGKSDPGSWNTTLVSGVGIHLRAEGTSGRCWMDTILAEPGAVVNIYRLGMNCLICDIDQVVGLDGVTLIHRSQIEEDVEGKIHGERI